MAKIERPVTMAEVSDALGEPRSFTLTALCKSPKINIYSKYKTYGMVGDWRPLTEGMIQSINYGMTPKGVKFPKYDGTEGEYPMWSQWKVPQAGQWARLSDFEHYNHNARHPFRQAYIKSCAEDYRANRETVPAGIYYRPIADSEGKGMGWLQGVVEIDPDSDFRYTDFVSIGSEEDGEGHVAMNQLYLTLAVVGIEGSSGGAISLDRPCIVAQAQTPFGSVNGGGSVILGWPDATPEGGVLMNGFNLRDFLLNADGTTIRYNLYLMLCTKLTESASFKKYRSNRGTEVFTGGTMSLISKKRYTFNLFPGDGDNSRDWYYPFRECTGLATYSLVSGAEGFVPNKNLAQYNVIEGHLSGTDNGPTMQNATLTWSFGPVYAQFSNATSDNDISVSVTARISVRKEDGTEIYNDSASGEAQLPARNTAYNAMPQTTIKHKLAGVVPGDAVRVYTTIYAVANDSSTDDNTYGYLVDTSTGGDQHPGYWMLSEYSKLFTVTGSIAPDGGITDPVA